MADSPTAASGDAVTPLTETQMAFVANAAMQQWSATIAPDQRELLNSLSFVLVTNLPGDAVAWSIGDGNVLVDMNAAGRGWFVDATPKGSSEFQTSGDSLIAATGSSAFGRMDLLSAVIHEIGHVIGYEHADSGSMEAALPVGERRQLIDWSSDSRDLRAALGWDSTGDSKKPAFPEFSIGMGKGKKKWLLDASNDGETQTAENAGWYVEV